MPHSNQKPIEASISTKIRLPHPYLTTYALEKSDQKTKSDQPLLQLRRSSPTKGSLREGTDPPEQLHNPDTYIAPLAVPVPAERPADSNNTPWGRVRRAPVSTLSWTSNSAPTVGQVWLIAYAVLTLRPELEFFRLALDGRAKEGLSQLLIAVTLAAPHPDFQDSKPTDASKPRPETPDELVILRSTFWQGAGSPFGVRPVWAPNPNPEFQRYPIPSLDYTVTTKFPQVRVHSRHPRRPQKPTPGSLIYSRYIPHLDEHFSMVALDYQDQEHLNLFHTWQNDPRVAQGWNETGSLEQHREYLRIAHEDPHQLTVLAKFEGTYFAYFEIYWAKEDHLGAHYPAHDFDRGRHSLVGNTAYRGSHRVSSWWSSLMHYIFLDDPRTQQVVGEPKATNSVVLSYDFMHGFALDKFVDLPHKRSAFVTCSRERFFQLGLNEGKGKEREFGGLGIGLVPKL